MTIPAALVTGPQAPDDPPTAGAARYAAIDLLGEGGMAKVHLCRDERIGREVAMKVILPELSAKASARARFLREASVQGQLEHPSIVPVHDIGVTKDGKAFFIMKRIHGRTLENVLAEPSVDASERGDRFTTRRLLTAFVNVCLAVDFAHSRGVIHRDLKPSNLMLGSFGEVYLLDWGIAKLGGDADDVEDLDATEVSGGDTPVAKTAAGTLLGTLQYMAPEQIVGEPASRRSDIFALGAILFEILTGQTLRESNATFVSLVKGRHDARCSVRCPERHTAPELEAICVRATAVDPKARFASARELSEVLESFLEGDRDVTRRRELALGHVNSARAALARASSKEATHASRRAMQELGAALALDPENLEARAMVVEALTTAPPELPREVKEAVHRRGEDNVAHGARRWPIVLASWLAFAPLMYFAGVRQLGAMVVGLVLMALATVAGLVRAQREASEWLEYASFALSAMAMVAVGRAFGPFVLVPTLLATFASALQLHPRRRARGIALAICLVAMVGSVVVEMAGVLPQISDAPVLALVSAGSAGTALPLVLVVLLMNMTATVTTALTVGAVRAKLSSAEERLLVHAWQVRSMMPANVSARPSEGRLAIPEHSPST